MSYMDDIKLQTNVPSRSPNPEAETLIVQHQLGENLGGKDHDQNISCGKLLIKIWKKVKEKNDMIGEYHE